MVRVRSGRVPGQVRHISVSVSGRIVVRVISGAGVGYVTAFYVKIKQNAELTAKLTKNHQNYSKS